MSAKIRTRKGDRGPNRRTFGVQARTAELLQAQRTGLPSVGLEVAYYGGIGGQFAGYKNLRDLREHIEDDGRVVQLYAPNYSSVEELGDTGTPKSLIVDMLIDRTALARRHGL